MEETNMEKSQKTVSQLCYMSLESSTVYAELEHWSFGHLTPTIKYYVVPSNH